MSPSQGSTLRLSDRSRDARSCKNDYPSGISLPDQNLGPSNPRLVSHRVLVDPWISLNKLENFISKIVKVLLPTTFTVYQQVVHKQLRDHTQTVSRLTSHTPRLMTSVRRTGDPCPRRTLTQYKHRQDYCCSYFILWT